MNIREKTCGNTRRLRERGASRLNFLIFILLLAAAAYAAYLYAPVAYQASLYKVHMQDTIDKAVATGQGITWAESQLKASAGEYGVPPDATYKIELRDGRMQADVRWVKPLVSPVYTYRYEFNHTVKSSNFFTPR